MPALPTISLVIPALNEEAYLPRLLASAQIARQRYANDPTAVEFIVADNGSTDRTAEVAVVHGARVVAVAQPCIAASRNGGAAAATGDILAFVDADSMLHPESFSAIAAVYAQGRCVGGATGVYMERWSLGIACAWICMIPAVWVWGIDTGLVFCRRADFEALGGYDTAMRFAEDVHFYLRLKKLGRARGENFVRLRRYKALGSTRKFDEHGDWHYVAAILKAPLYLTIWRRSMDAFASRYWYSGKRTLPAPIVPRKEPWV